MLARESNQRMHSPTSGAPPARHDSSRRPCAECQKMLVVLQSRLEALRSTVHHLPISSIDFNDSNACASSSANESSDTSNDANSNAIVTSSVRALDTIPRTYG